ncbi:CU044_5270 family protein [Streptomyces sp. M10(2022)]
MNRTPWRRCGEPLDHAEPAVLLPAPGDPVLSHGRLTMLEEHLMNEIQRARSASASRPPRPPSVASGAAEPPGRRLALIGAAVAVAVLAGAAGVAGSPGRNPREWPVHRKDPYLRLSCRWRRARRRAGQHRCPDLGAAERDVMPEPLPGQFIYIKSQVSWLAISENVDTGKSETYVQKPHSRQVWLSPDGHKGWLIEPGNGTTSKDGMTLDDEGPALEPGIGSPSYDYLKTLTTDPDELLKKIYKETEGQGNGPDQQAFTTIGDLVMEQAMPSELTSALYRAAAKIPGS